MRMSVGYPTPVPAEQVEALPGAAAAATVPQGRLADALLAWVNRRRFVLFGVVALVFLAGFNGQWRIEPDSALYLSVARNLAEGHGYTYQGESHRLAYPGLPFLYAGVFKLFGTQALWPLHVVMLLTGMAALGLTYRLFLLHDSRPVAVLVTCGLGLTKIFYRYAFYLMTDMPFLVGVLAFLAGYEAICVGGAARESEADAPPAGARHRARWYDWALLVGGLAVAMVMRPTMWTLLGAVVGAILWTTFRGPIRRGRLITFALLVLAIVAFVIWDPRRGNGEQLLGEYESLVKLYLVDHFPETMRRMVTVNIPELLEPITVDAVFGVRFGPGLNTLFGLLCIGLGVALVRRRVLWGLLVVTTVAMMALILPVDRYYLPVLPLLVYAWWRAIRWVNLRLPQPWGNRAFAVLLVLGMVPNTCKVGGIIIEQRQMPFLTHYKEGRYLAYQEMAEHLRRNIGEQSLVLAPHKAGRVMSFWSGRKMVESIESPSLATSGQLYVVLDENDPRQQAFMQLRKIRLGPVLHSVRCYDRKTSHDKEASDDRTASLTLHKATLSK